MHAASALGAGLSRKTNPMPPDELAAVLARTAFCPDCHRLMEVVASVDVVGEGQVPVEWKCHYCEGRFSSEKPVESTSL